jgi:hypothetical protein
VERARIVLRTADGLQEFAAELHIKPERAARWRNRFLDRGWTALQKDAPRPLGPKPNKRVLQKIEKTTREKPNNATRWRT